MNDLPLNALRAFAVMCEQGGIRAAARELGIAHSSVSRHLAELERWLGVPLTDRDSSKKIWLPTAQARALASAVQGGLQDIAQAVTAVREQRSAFSVTIGATPSFASCWLLPRLPDLERAHPRIDLSVQVNQRSEDLAASGIDLAIRMGRGTWPDVQAQALMDDALYPVMSLALWNDSGRPDAPDQLGRLRLLHDRDPAASWDIWRSLHGPVSMSLNRGPRLSSSDLVLRAAEQGQGVALARGRLAEDRVSAGLLVRPFGTLQVVVPDAYWIVRPRLPAAPRQAVSIVIAWLKEHARRNEIAR